ncbi:MAG: YigZ family protein [Lachnospiraceae bacterium]|nr:YigZ family protein [Lachnospiraceae bacterium]
MAGNKNELLPFKVVYQNGYGEYEEKKSRFIASVAPISSEEEAAAFIDSIRKKYYDARHHCTAFIIGRNRELTRCSDDGEPSGTAGKPILEVLLGAEVTNVVAVVTRYFGGTLLGTGGLVRAYTQAAKEGLQNAGIGIMRYKTEMTIEIDYTDVGKVQYLLGNRKIDISQSRYTEKVEFDIRIPKEEEKSVEKALTEATAARARIHITGEDYYMDIEE